jgi:hypothetical protein
MAPDHSVYDFESDEEAGAGVELSVFFAELPSDSPLSDLFSAFASPDPSVLAGLLFPPVLA